MGLEIYYPQDIRNALLAAEQAGSDGVGVGVVGGSDSALAKGWVAGYRAALTTIALAFGLVSYSTVKGFDGASHEATRLRFLENG